METPRLLIRRWAVADVRAITAAITANIEHLRPWLPWVASEPLRRRERVALIRAWDDGWDAGGDAVYGIFLDGEIVGGCGLHNRHGPDTLEIGYWIDKDHINQGFATEVARVLTSAALLVPGDTFVEIHHDKANVASSRVPQKLGYTLVAETQDSVTSPGEVGIDCAWRIEAEDWLAG